MVWIPNPMIFLTLILGVFIFILIIFLPAFLELKNPKDAGPRIIMDNIVVTSASNDHGRGKAPLDQALSRKIAEILVILPNLEA